MFDFWAQWCGPCKVISPIFEKLSEQFTGVEFYKVDVDEESHIAQEVGVRAVSFSLHGQHSAAVLSSESRGLLHV